MSNAKLALYRYYQLELEESLEALNESNSYFELDKNQILNRLRDLGYIPKIESKKNTNKKINKDIADIPYIKNSNESKKIFRDIMKKIHPDKNKGNQLFDSFVKKTNEAYAKDDFIKLLSIASELDINVDSKIYEDRINKKIENISRDIQTVKSNPVWKWESKEVKYKFKFLEDFFKKRYALNINLE